MRRRAFIAVVGGAAAALPLAALAQRQTPLVGFLNSASPDTYRFNADSFREGLAKAGFVEGRNVRIEERWARGDYSSLPTLAAELVATGVVAIAATGDVASAQAAQVASNTVPVVFTIGGDPIRHGLIETMNRPGGHVTGILFNQNVLGQKQLNCSAKLHQRCPLRAMEQRSMSKLKKRIPKQERRSWAWRRSRSTLETRGKWKPHSSRC